MNSGFYLEDSEENILYKIIGITSGGNICLQDTRTELLTIFSPQELSGSLTLGIYFLSWEICLEE